MIWQSYERFWSADPKWVQPFHDPELIDSQSQQRALLRLRIANYDPAPR